LNEALKPLSQGSLARTKLSLLVDGLKTSVINSSALSLGFELDI